MSRIYSYCPDGINKGEVTKCSLDSIPSTTQIDMSIWPVIESNVTVIQFLISLWMIRMYSVAFQPNVHMWIGLGPDMHDKDGNRFGMNARHVYACKVMCTPKWYFFAWRHTRKLLYWFYFVVNGILGPLFSALNCRFILSFIWGFSSSEFTVGNCS